MDLHTDKPDKNRPTGAIQLPGVVVQLTGVGGALYPDPPKTFEDLISTEKLKLWNKHKPTLPKTTWIQVEIQEPEVKLAVE
jgi:hypothetical protein